MSKKLLIRGGGDLASAVARRAFLAGLQVLVLELPQPKVVRRTVAFASAVREGEITVDGVTGKLHRDLPASPNGHVSVLVDAAADTIGRWQPDILVDGRMTKRLCEDTHPGQADLVIGLGPGFEAGRNCHAVVETRRGHDLGRVLWQGRAADYTGIPGTVAGRGTERVLRAPREGRFLPRLDIGDRVRENQVIATVDGEEIRAPFAGVLRGCLFSYSKVNKGQKVGDLDPRNNQEFCLHVSDKANAVAGGVMEAISMKTDRRKP